MAETESKNFDNPDERHNPGKGVVDVVNVGGTTTRRLTLQPGWRWSLDVKPTAKTETCQIPHLNIHISGQLKVQMEGGKETVYGPGDIAFIPPGHDAWVVGQEPVVIIEQAPPKTT